MRKQEEILSSPYMSSYTRTTLNPSTNQWEEAQWLDDYFSRHHYGVKFSDGTVIDPEEVTLATRP